MNENPIDLKSVRSILILRYDRIGDMVVTTPVFEALKRVHPSVRIGVVASRTNEILIRENPYVDQVYILGKHPFARLRAALRIRKEKYDVVLNFIFNSMSGSGILSNIISPHGRKVGQGNEKYRFYFDWLLQLPRSEKPMAGLLLDIVDTVFGLHTERKGLRYRIVPDAASRKRVEEFVAQNGLRKEKRDAGGKKFLVLNASAAQDQNRLSWQQVETLIETAGSWQGRALVVTCAPTDAKVVREIVARHSGRGAVLVYPPEGIASLLEIAALLEQSAGVITPDTGVVHIASAMGTPVLGFFNPMQQLKEWAPQHVQARIILADDGMPASSIPPDVMVREMESFAVERTRNEMKAGS